MAWLLVFFVVPMCYLAKMSLEQGLFPIFSVQLGLAQLQRRGPEFKPQFIRSIEYAGIATAIALLLSYPLAYWIAFRGGRWKNLFLLLVIAPFFVTYLIRTLAWETILADNGIVVRVLQDVHVLGADGRLLATSVAVIAGITYNFLPFMVLPLYVSLEQVDPRLIEAASDLYANTPRAFAARHAAALAARRRSPGAAHLHPRRGRLHQRAAPRHAAAVHDRERHPVAVPRADATTRRRRRSRSS